MTDRRPAGPFIVWKDYGCEGWHPESFATAQEAVIAMQPYDVLTERRIVKDVVLVPAESPPITGDQG